MWSEQTLSRDHLPYCVCDVFGQIASLLVNGDHEDRETPVRVAYIGSVSKAVKVEAASVAELNMVRTNSGDSAELIGELAPKTSASVPETEHDAETSFVKGIQIISEINALVVAERVHEAALGNLVSVHNGFLSLS